MLQSSGLRTVVKVTLMVATLATSIATVILLLKNQKNVWTCGGYWNDDYDYCLGNNSYIADE